MKCLKYILFLAPCLGAAALEVSNACAGKQFCQRIVLAVNGSGKSEVVPGTPSLDRFGHSTLDDAKLLSSKGKNQNPPLTFIFSGNSDLDAAVEAAKIPNSKLYKSNQGDWDVFVKSLPKELEPLLENPLCKDLTKNQITPGMSLEEKIAVLSKYISVEVSMYGHSVEMLGNSDQKFGMGFSGSNQLPTSNDQMLFDSKDFSALRNVLKHATVRGVTQACNGVEVAKTITPPGDSECSCFVSGSDSNTLAMSWDNHSPFGLHNIQSKQKGDSYAGLGSLLQVTDSLFEPYVAARSANNLNKVTPTATTTNTRLYTNRQYGDERYSDSIYALYNTTNYMSLPHNPLSGLVKSSADLAAQSALKFIANDKSVDVGVAEGLLSASYTSQIQKLVEDTKDSQLAAVVNEALENAKAKAERIITASSRVTLDQAKEYVDYGVTQMGAVLSPSVKIEDLSASQRSFVESIKAAEAYFAARADTASVDQFKKFYEMFDPNSKNYWGQILSKPSEASDLKLRMIWGRWDSIRSALSSYYREEYRASRISNTQYEALITELENSGTAINGAISGYIGARAQILKREAFIANDVRTSVAMRLLERRVKQPRSDQRATAVEQTKLYSKLLAQVDCLQSYGYGPNTFTPDGKTKTLTHAEMGVR